MEPSIDHAVPNKIRKSRVDTNFDRNLLLPDFQRSLPPVITTMKLACFDSTDDTLLSISGLTTLGYGLSVRRF